MKSAPPLFAAPHRVFFFAGILLSVLPMLWWSATLAGRMAGMPGAHAIPATLLHGALMLYGFLPLFMLGFIFTAGPRWLAVAPPPRRHWLPPAIVYPLGVACCVAAGALDLRAMLVAGLGLMLTAWSGAVAIWIGRIRASRQPDTLHARVIACAFTLGAGGLLCALGWAVSGYGEFWLAMRQLALWGFLLPVFLTVSHRMVPFFSSGPLHPYQPWHPTWLLFAMLGASLGHGLWENFLPLSGRWLLDLPTAALFAYTSWRWQLRRSLQVRLLAMLHLSYAWIAIAFALYTADSLSLLAGGNGLASAPLHALTIGFFASMLVGFATRVSLGHSGHPLKAEPLLWAVYLGLHALAVLRVLAALLPAAIAQWLYVGVGLLWLTLFGLWCRRFVPVYLKPRADGEPG